eukprot:gene25140-11751_t
METSEPDSRVGIVLTTYINMSFQQISDVIADLKVKGSAKGVSRSAIKNGLPDITAARVNVALKKAVAAGKIIQVKESF